MPLYGAQLFQFHYFDLGAVWSSIDEKIQCEYGTAFYTRGCEVQKMPVAVNYIYMEILGDYPTREMYSELQDTFLQLPFLASAQTHRD